MSKMTDDELLVQVAMAENDAISNSESYMPLNRRALADYLSCPNGYEVEGQSQVVSTEVQDVVNSDMTSLIRVFQSGSEILKFKPNSSDPLDIQEAEEKTKYVHHIVNNQEDSYRIHHSFLMNTELQSVGVLHYPWVSNKKVDYRSYKGIDQDMASLVVTDIETESIRQGFKFEVDKVDENEDGTVDIDIRITREKQGIEISALKIEQMLISSNAESKESATLIGHREMSRRGDLLAAGFDKDKLDKVSVGSDRTDASMRELRFSNQNGGTSNDSITDPANQLLPVSHMYVLVDYDGDGIPERRYIVKIGEIIFENEAFDHVPYAISSAMLMPNNLIGRSRAEITMQSQLLSTEIMRSTMDNIYDVGTGRIIANDTVDMDSLLTSRNQGVITTDGSVDVRSAVAQLETPFVGDKMMLISQYIDSKRVAATGEMLANQGLDSDKIYNETATRFEGVKDAGAAKVELVARCIAETGYKDLYEGIAWMVSHFQSDKDEIMVLGKPLTINPMRWWHEHKVVAMKGLGAGDDSQTLSSLSGFFAIQNQLSAEGSPLVDNKDKFETLKKMLLASGFNNVDEFFNDPGEPDQSAQFLLEQNEQLMQMVQQLQAAQANPLAEAEQIKAEADLIKAQGKAALDIAKMKEDQRQFNEKMAANQQEMLLTLEKDYVKIEADSGKDIPGKGAGL